MHWSPGDVDSHPTPTATSADASNARSNGLGYPCCSEEEEDSSCPHTYSMGRWDTGARGEAQPQPLEEEKKQRGKGEEKQLQSHPRHETASGFHEELITKPQAMRPTRDVMNMFQAFCQPLNTRQCRNETSRGAGLAFAGSQS